MPTNVHTTHRFTTVTSANGPECTDCGAYRWGVRECTVCHAPLPAALADGRSDTFPRCSAHAF